MTTFRQATPGDTESLLALLAEIMQHHGVDAPPRERQAAVIAEILALEGHRLLVAESEGRLLGMSALIFSYSTWSASPVCELQDVIVTAGERRAGVGRGLVDAAADLARSRGCSHLFLLAEVWNSEAHEFYRELGLAEKTCLYFERDLREGEQSGRGQGAPGVRFGLP